MKIELERLRRKTIREEWEYERKLLIQMEDFIAMHADNINILPLDLPHLKDPKLKKYPSKFKDFSDLDEELEQIDK